MIQINGNKGITPVIAIILLLMMTVAVAGVGRFAPAAYGVPVQLPPTDAGCSKNNQANKH